MKAHIVFQDLRDIPAHCYQLITALNASGWDTVFHAVLSHFEAYAMRFGSPYFEDKYIVSIGLPFSQGWGFIAPLGYRNSRILSNFLWVFVGSKEDRDYYQSQTIFPDTVILLTEDLVENFRLVENACNSPSGQAIL